MKASYITPAITLFHEDGSLDFDHQGTLYENLISNQIDGILVLGSIGEFFALPIKTRLQLAEFAIRSVRCRTKVIIGTTSMCFEEIIPFSNECLELGADAVMIVPPFYFPMDSEAVFDYFDRLASQIGGSIYIYNFPDRTGYSIEPDVVLRLAEKHENIIGIKDTLSGMEHTRELIKKIKPFRPDFEIYTGFDDNLVHNVLSGGDGCIGGLSNIFPEICHAWIQALRADDMISVSRYQQLINQLFDIYSVGSSFIPVIKEAARIRGYAANSCCTFPIPEISAAQRGKIHALIDAATAAFHNIQESI